MATFRFELNNKPTRNKKYAILLCVSAKGIRRRIKTNIEVTKKSDWNPTPKGDNWIRSSEPQYKKLNLELAEIINRAKDTYKELGKKGQASSTNVITTMDKSECQIFSFIQFAEDFAQRTLEAGDYRTYTKYITFLNKLKFFINGVKPEKIASIPKSGKELEAYLEKMSKDLLFSEITLSFLNRFKSFLKKIPNTKNSELTLHPNTISKQFDNFKSLYHKGIVEYKEDGLIIENNPFNDFKCDTIDTNKEKLTWEEVESIKALDLEKNSLIWHARNCFMLAFYCAGMRAGDLIQLRGTNIVYNNGSWRICYRMDKTATSKDILLLPEALEIIKKYVNLNQRTSDYIFPLLDNKAVYAKAVTWEAKEQLPYEVKKKLLQQTNSKNSLLNKYLGKIAAMAGIEKKVSMHTARHSFANIARQKNANVYDISKALGHSNLKITETYLAKFDTTSQDATMKKVFENNSKEVDENNLLKQLQSLSPEALASLLAKVNK